MVKLLQVEGIIFFTNTEASITNEEALQVLKAIRAEEQTANNSCNFTFILEKI